ncbi:MAG: DUF2202 domain-containing protein [Actinomycetota bacterium]
MKVRFLSAQGVFLAAVALVAIVGIAAIAAGAVNNDTDASQLQASAEALTDEEAGGVLFMREEEKLAYDVYVTLGDMWDQAIFANIAHAEQKHMDAVLTIIEMYGLDDPMDGNEIGVFESDELQALYDELIEAGSASAEAALEVGAIIEEVDILDLEEYLAGTANADLIRVYENLLRGSENHLRAFVSRLTDAGVDRDPYVMDSDAYEAILATGVETGGGAQGGQGGGHGAGQGGGHGAGQGGGHGAGQGGGHGAGQGGGHGAGQGGGGCQHQG